MPLSRLSIHPGKLDDRLAQDEICFATKHSHVLPIHGSRSKGPCKEFSIR